MPGPNTPTSPPESGFVPRREFIRDKTILNDFALLAVAGRNLIKLYAFPRPVVQALQNYLNQRFPYKEFREDLTQNQCEFVLEGKPWASPKAISTEKLFLSVVLHICQQGLSFVSTIDYGREPDDRCILVFSKQSIRPPASSSRSNTPLPGTPPVDPLIVDKPRSMRSPFALSFASARVLRVIMPPLHSTPAILQAVRGSWPRGVVSEKKLGDCYEFKLKGYKWFQKDNFAADSLQYILSLLTVLDSHSFSLLTSLTLTGRSRVKDFWILTKTSQSSVEDGSTLGSAPPSVLTSSHPEFRRRRGSLDLNQTSSSNHYHRRAGSEGVHPSTLQPGHPRHILDEVGSRFSYTRKPISRVLPSPVPETDLLHGAQLPSPTMSMVENVAGIGAGGTYNVDSVTWGAGSNTRRTLPSPPKPGTPFMESQLIPPPRSRPSSRPLSTPGERLEVGNVIAFPSSAGVHALLGPNAFRDSGVSHSSNGHSHSPTKSEDMLNHIPEDPGFRTKPDVLSLEIQNLSGSWKPSIGENDSSTAVDHAVQFGTVHQVPPVQQIVSLVESPMVKNADLALRKSEAGVISMIRHENISPVPSPPPVPATPSPQGTPPRRPSQRRNGGENKHRSGHGWVLVNYDQKPGQNSNPSYGQFGVDSHRPPLRSFETGKSLHNVRRGLPKPSSSPIQQGTHRMGKKRSHSFDEVTSGSRQAYAFSRKNSVGHMPT